VDEARDYISIDTGWYVPGWSGAAGWYWDPWFGAWTFIPDDGILYSQFGWGFYSPIVVYQSAFSYGGYYDILLTVLATAIIRSDMVSNRVEDFVPVPSKAEPFLASIPIKGEGCFA